MSAEGLSNCIWPAAEKLVFPAAKERLEAVDTQSINAQASQLSLQCTQNVLMVHARLAQMEEEKIGLNQKLTRISDAFLKANNQREMVQKEVKRLEAERAKSDEQLRLLSDEVVNLKEELKDQEAEIIVRVQAAIANKVLLGKLDKKALQGLVDDYLETGCIKDLESGEDKKEDTVEAVQSTADSGSTAVPKEIPESAAPVDAAGDQACL